VNEVASGLGCACIDGSFRDPATKLCVTCGAKGCTGCAAGSVVNAQTTRCECGTGLHNISKDPAAIKCCAVSCEECSDPGTCTKCATGYAESGGKCGDTCSPGYTQQTDAKSGVKVCEKADLLCKEYSAAGTCSSCVDDATSIGGSCGCTDGFIKTVESKPDNPKTATCEKCSPGCSK
jgi:hypothetical protein